MRVLAFVDYYLPGFKGGGPVQSVSRLAKAMQGGADLFVFTRDRDLGEAEPYRDVDVGRWADYPWGRTFYAGPPGLSSNSILEAVRESNPDVIYVNSYFSRMTRSVLGLRARGRLDGIGVIVAPRGEFSPGALRLKAPKKRAFLVFARAAGLHRGLTWHVSSEREREDVRSAVAGDPHCFIKAPDIELIDDLPPNPEKREGEAAFAFLSRIGPKKNLLGAIRMLAALSGQISFSIYGPVEDEPYWEECQRAIHALPGHIRCEHLGPLAQQDVVDTLSTHHYFLFPTLGENFGHVIAEALNAGLPCLLSDQTPWSELESRGAGWTIPLEDLPTWQERLQNCVDMGPDGYLAMSCCARAAIRDLADSSSGAAEYLQMFETALTGSAVAA